MFGRLDVAPVDHDDFQPFQISDIACFHPILPILASSANLVSARKCLRKQQEHFAFAKNKVEQRLNLEKARPDFLQHVLEHSRGENALTAVEIEKTAATMIVAGSETTGTLLSAITGYLIRDPDVMDQLVDEIRSAYASEDEMTMANLAKLPYLDAVIRETFRIAPPVPTGMPRVVPPGGATVCGKWLPENVRLLLPSYLATEFFSVVAPYRPLFSIRCPC